MNRRIQIISILSAALVAGCRPSGANTKLRRENAELRDQVALLQRERQGDQERITALESSTTRPVYTTQQTIERLFTAHGLSFGRLTATYKDSETQANDTGVVVYVVPTDQQGQPLKAAGAFSITVFDLSMPEKPLVGKREFPLVDAKARWYGQALLFNYVLKVPFQAQPQGPQLLVRVLFTDELTGRDITAETTVKVSR